MQKYFCGQKMFPGTHQKDMFLYSMFCSFLSYHIKFNKLYGSQSSER